MKIQIHYPKIIRKITNLQTNLKLKHLNSLMMTMSNYLTHPPLKKRISTITKTNNPIKCHLPTLTTLCRVKTMKMKTEIHPQNLEMNPCLKWMTMTMMITSMGVAEGVVGGALIKRLKREYSYTSQITSILVNN